MCSIEFPYTADTSFCVTAWAHMGKVCPRVRMCVYTAIISFPAVSNTTAHRQCRDFPLTFAERLSAWPGSVGEADPLSRAVQCVSHCAGEANLAAHFEVPCLPASMGRCAWIPTGAWRVACNGRQPDKEQWKQELEEASRLSYPHVCRCSHLSSPGTTRKWTLTETVHLLNPPEGHSKTCNAPISICHHANNPGNRYFSLLWHRELSVHKSRRTSIKRQPAVVMRNYEYRLTPKCFFVILNDLFCLSSVTTYTTWSVFSICLVCL